MTTLHEYQPVIEAVGALVILGLFCAAGIATLFMKGRR